MVFRVFWQVNVSKNWFMFSSTLSFSGFVVSVITLPLFLSSSTGVSTGVLTLPLF